MNIIEHGKWVPYVPSGSAPKIGSFHVMLMRRESDGVDWYDYVNKGNKFKSDSVKLTAIWRDRVKSYVVGAAVYDATMLCPVNNIVFEITDYQGGDPQQEFGNKVYDPATGSFTEQPPLPKPPDVTELVKALQARVEELEKRG